MNVIVGGEGLPAPVGLAADDRVTVVGLERRGIEHERATGADAVVVVSPSPSRRAESQELAFAVLALPWARVVTVVHATGPPSGTDLARWCRVSEDGALTVPDISVPLSAGAVAPAHARRVVADYVRPTLGEAIVASASLAVSELVSNALQHTGDGRLELDVDDGELHIAVFDDHPRDWPTARSVDPLADAGRGLGIVAAVALAWGITATREAKAVWCELR